jgi:hypothetical protein
VSEKYERSEIGELSKVGRLSRRCGSLGGGVVL